MQQPQLNKEEVQKVQEPSTATSLKEEVVEPAPVTVKTVVQAPVKQQPSGGKYDLMRAAGIPESDWQSADYIISKESTWRHDVWNAEGSGAYGLCQSLPASKMASAGSDYMSNPVTQLSWCHSYAKSRYGSWQAAVTFWQNNRWW